jgi:hypothetical protein
MNIYPPKKLRVEWSLASPLMPPHKSVPKDSVIYAARQTGEFTSGIDHFDLGEFMRGQLFYESHPFVKDDEI